jgi:hypothetical protein
MKAKSLMAVIVLSMSVFLGACSLWGSDNGDGKSITNVFSSVKRCEYTDEDGTKSVMHIKGDDIYVEADAATATAEDLDMEGLVTGDKMYMWSKSTREGLYFDLATLADEDAVEMKGVVIRSSKDMVAFLEKEGMNCGKSEFGSEKFTLPSDVKFMSFEEMMQEFSNSWSAEMDASGTGELDFQMAE